MKVGGISIPTLVDTGANHSYISTGGLALIPSSQIKISNIIPHEVSVANGGKEIVKNVVAFIAFIHERQVKLSLTLLPTLTVPCLLGMDFLKSLGIVIDTAAGLWWFRDQPENTSSFLTEPSSRPFEVAGLKRLAPEEAKQLDYLLEKEVGSMDSSIGMTRLTEHLINVGDHPPIKQRAYPVSPVIQDEINKEVDRMLQEDIIEPSYSP